MFKSIFTRYVAFISLLILFSFVLLVITVSSMVSDYSAKSKTQLMEGTADSIALTMETYYRYSEDNSVTKRLVKDIENIAKISDSLVYVVKPNGVLAVTNDPDFEANNVMCNKSIMSNIENDSAMYTIGKMDDTFKETRYNIFKVVKSDDGLFVGVIIVSSTSVRDDSLSGPVIRTLIVVSIWILLASCITVYILFQRITDPLKKLSDAARAFAKGNFSKRVTVVGNDEVADLSRAFNNMANVLEKNEEVRNSFLGSVSHDLRTPMTIILGYVDGIRDGTIPNEKHDYYLGIISAEVRRLSRLVSTLLEISRIQSGERKLTFTNFNISEKARQVLLSFEKRIDEKKLDIEFNCEEEIMVHADTDAIHQVLFNLMDNAVKFVNIGGTISITLEAVDKKARISVKNTGDGIPADELPHVFDRFYKSDRSRSLDKSGTGLGLFISKTNINQHNEDMTCDSVVGKYTVFTFTLPLEK